MNKEDLIKKWLDDNLNAEEQTAFEQLKDYDALIKLSETTKGFKAPAYNYEVEHAEVKAKLKTKITQHWVKPLLKFAAVLLIGFSVFYYSYNLDTAAETTIAQQISITLPDASSVALNALSTLSYNENSWSDNREVILNGEAYFKVAKGSKFKVKTPLGIVSVLGTQFNVKQRNNYFEVTCFEGLVAVDYNNKSLKLKQGQRFVVINESVSNTTETQAQPSWINAESTFTSTPLYFVLNELQRQYDIKLELKNIDKNELFSGSFTHNNLDLALKSVTLPLGIKFTKSDAVIVLERE